MGLTASRLPTSRLRRMRVRAAAACPLAVLMGALFVTSLWAQDPEPVPPDSVRPEVETLPDSVRQEFGQPRVPGLRGFPARLDEQWGVIYECDEGCLRDTPALSLADLLLSLADGAAALRPGFFSGPHFLTHGLFGPGFVQLRLDGRVIESLEYGQTDLTRIALGTLDRVRVLRSATGLVIDLRTRTHRDPQAYSRIAAGTGSPAVQTLGAVFQNGLGEDFVVDVGMDLVDVDIGGQDNDRLEAVGRLSWVPAPGESGVQLEYRTESLDRAAVDTLEASRKSLTLRARHNFSASAQAEVWAARESFSVEADSLDRSVRTVGLAVRLAPGDGSVQIGARLADGDAYPGVSLDGTASYPLGEWFTAEVGGRLESFGDFTASDIRAGISLENRGGFLPFGLRADAGTGTRGVRRPALQTADSVSFRAAVASGWFEIGPYRAGGRYELQHLSREVLFGAPFDSAVIGAPGERDVTAWELNLAGPLIPMGALIDGLSPVHVSGFWRQHDAGDDVVTYLPDRLVRGGLTWNDSFFNGNLELWLSGWVERRGTRSIPVPGEADLQPVSGYTFAGGHFMFRIGDFRFFFRSVNPGSLAISDIAGLEYPRQVSVFGVKWDFFN